MTWPASLPIRVRLTLWYVLVFAAAQACFSIGAALWMQRSLNAGAMDILRDQTREVSQFLATEPENVSSEQLQADLRKEFGNEPEGTWLRIVMPDGHAVSITAQTAGIAHSFRNGEQVTMHADRHRARFLATEVTAHGQEFLIATGVTVDAAVAATERFRRGLMLLSPALLLLAATGSYWISRKALRPVDTLAQAARGITDSNLHQRLPIPETHDELSRLSETLNEMLARIDSAFHQVRQFTADASHELRTPVSLMRTEAEIALRRDRSPQEYREALQQISIEATRTGGLLESMLALARADARQQKAKFASVDCAAMLRELAHDWAGVMSDAGIALTVSIEASGALLANADAFALRRMFVILLDNARKYTPPGGTVVLRARSSEKRVVIEVEDTGLGIAPEHLPHIFDRFYRADAARSRAGGGVGLGLALARRIAEQHGAELTVDSTFGHGTRFTAMLPAFDVHQTPQRRHEVTQS
jgi:heavy metal sensor kinase